MMPNNPSRENSPPPAPDQRHHPTRYDLFPWMYDRMAEESVEGDIEWYIEECRESGGPILELGCGTGRVTIPLARAEFDVTGLDSSIAMLEYARGYAETENVLDNVRLIQDQMEDFYLNQTFQTVIIPFCTFAHLVTPREQGACLESIHQHLHKNGRLVLDMKQFPTNEFQGGYREWPFSDFIPAPDGTHEVRRKIKAWLNEEQNRIDYLFIYEQRPMDGAPEETETIKTRHSLSTISNLELLKLLSETGFEIEATYGNHNRKPYEKGDPWCCVVTRPESI